MANSGDKSPNKKENTGEGSSTAKSPNQSEATNEDARFSQLVAVPSSPNRRQGSGTGADRVEGGSPKSGGSGTKKGDKGTKTPVKEGEHGGSGEKKRPRGRPRKDGSDPGSARVEEKLKPKKPKAKFDAPEVPAPCGVCGKRFNSYKALFGHLRVHPDRTWKGAFPPPVSQPTAVEETSQRELKVAEDISSTLLTIGKKILGENVSVEGESSERASRRRGLEVDLNIPEGNVHFPTPPESDESEDDGAPVRFDDDNKAA